MPASLLWLFFYCNALSVFLCHHPSGFLFLKGAHEIFNVCHDANLRQALMSVQNCWLWRTEKRSFSPSHPEAEHLASGFSVQHVSQPGSKHGAYQPQKPYSLLGTGRRPGEGGMEVGGRGRLYTYRYTVTTRMIPALRWAAMRAILMFQ